MTWWTSDGTTWKKVTSPQINVAGVWKPVVRGMVYDGTAWKRFFPESEITSTAITGGLTGSVPIGVARTVSGTVTALAGAIGGGTVTVQQRAVGASTWTTIGTGPVGSGAVAPWSASVTPTICGATQFQAVYSGDATYQGSTSPISTVTTIVNAPAKPTAGTIGNTTASFSWAAVGGATGYRVYRANTLVSTQAGLTFTDTGLTPNTDYSWTVVATANSGACVSAASPAKTGHTGQDAATDSGSATVQIRPEKTNSYRPDTGWGYIGENVGQGYFSDSGRNYTGTIDYGTNAQLRAKVEADLGTNGAKRYDNMTVSAARVNLYKKTGVGSNSALTVTFYNSPATAGTGGAPVRNGTATTDTSSASGSSKWCAIGTAHWAALKAGTARSIVLYNASAAVYAQFVGKGGNTDTTSDLQLDCSWNYALTAAVPPAWTN